MWPRPFQGRFNLSSVGWDLQWSTCRLHQTKFEVYSLSRFNFQRYLKGTKRLKWVAWRGHAHFRDLLSPVGLDLLCSTYILSLKCLRLPATKKWRATPNVKFRFEPPFGGLSGNVHGSSMARWKARGRLPISANEFFSLALVTAALFSEICRNQRFLKGWVTLSAN